MNEWTNNSDLQILWNFFKKQSWICTSSVWAVFSNLFLLKTMYNVQDEGVKVIAASFLLSLSSLSLGEASCYTGDRSSNPKVHMLRNWQFLPRARRNSHLLVTAMWINHPGSSTFSKSQSSLQMKSQPIPWLQPPERPWDHPDRLLLNFWLRNYEI